MAWGLYSFVFTLHYIYRHWTYNMIVRYILSSVCLRLIAHCWPKITFDAIYIWGCMMTVRISSSRKYESLANIEGQVIKTMLCTVCLSMFFCIMMIMSWCDVSEHNMKYFSVNLKLISIGRWFKNKHELIPRPVLLIKPWWQQHENNIVS